MKKIFWISMIVWMLSGLAYVLNVETLSAEVHTSPPAYAKWGRMAMQETMEKYPDAEIVDYLHVERVTKGNHEVERFKLWLKEKGKEFGVFIDIEFDPKTEKVVSVTFTETDG